MLWYICDSFSCNSMRQSNYSVLHGVNSNKKSITEIYSLLRSSMVSVNNSWEHLWIPKSSKLCFLKTFSANNFASSDAQDNISGPSNRGSKYKWKKWLLWAIATAQEAEKHEDEWSMTWFLLIRDTYINFNLKSLTIFSSSSRSTELKDIMS